MIAGRTLLRWSAVLVVAACPGAVFAQALMFDTFDSSAGGPPYPSTTAVRFGVFHSDGVLPAVQKSMLEISLQQLLVDTVERPAMLFGSDNGAGVPLGDQAGLDLGLGVDIDIAASAQLMIKSYAPGGKDPLPTEIYGFSWGESSFSVDFGELLGDGSVNIQRLEGQIARAQDFHFKSFAVTPGSVLVDFSLARIGPNSEPDEPVVTMTLTGRLVPEPASALLMLGGLGLLSRRGRRG